MTLRNAMSRKRLVSSALFLGVFVCALPVGAQGAERVVIRGQLLDRKDGHPLPAARVAIPSQHVQVYTDARGGFQLPPIAPGTYDVEMDRLGYKAIRANLTLEKDDSVVVRLTPEPVTLDALVVFGHSLLTRTEHASVGARAFDLKMFDTFSGGSTLAFLEQYANLYPRPCSSSTLSANCAMVRGLPEFVGVWIDGLPSTMGLEELRTIPAQEIFHINVYQGGALVEVITKDYARQEARHAVRHPLPPFTTMRAVQYQGQIGDARQ